MAAATQALVPKVARSVGESGIWAAYDRLYNTYIDQDGKIKKSIRDAGSQKTEVERLTGALAALQKDFDAYKLKYNENSEAILQTELDGISDRVGLPHTHFEDAMFGKLDELLAGKDTLSALQAQVGPLQAASDILDTVITNLSATLKPKSEIPNIVSQLVAGNVSDTTTLEARDAEIAHLHKTMEDSDEIIRTLRAEIAESGKKAIDESSNDEVKRLNEEIVAQRLTVEANQNEAAAHRKEIAELKGHIAHEKSQNEAFERQIQKNNGDMASTLTLLSAQEKLATDERTKTQKLTAYIMELGGMISEVPDILSSGWLKHELSKTVWMSERPTLFRFDGLDAANLKLMQGHLQKFDEAMLDLYRRLKKTLADHEELKLDIQAQTSAIKVKDDMIDDYAAYQTVLSHGIIDMADHLKWIMAGLTANSAIRRPALVVGERWQVGKKQILDLVIRFEGELVKVSEQRALNIANATEIARLSAPSSFTTLKPADMLDPLLQQDNDRLTAELRSKTSENVVCKDALSVLEHENLSLRNDLDRLTSGRTKRTSTDDTGDDSDVDTPRKTDTVDSDKLRGLLFRLQQLVGPHFEGDTYLDVDSLMHDIADLFVRSIPQTKKSEFIHILDEYASVDMQHLDTSLQYYLVRYFVGTRPPSNISRRRKGHESTEEITREGETAGHESDSDKIEFPLRPLVEGTPRSASKGSVAVNQRSDACMPILQLLTDLKLMHACM